MSYIGQAPGLGQRTAFRFVAFMGQTKFTGLDATGYPLGYTPGLIDVFVNGRLLSEPDYTASDGSTLTINAALDFGTEVRVLAQAPWSPANTYTLAEADAQFTRRRNRIVDPGMRVSQENGNSAVAPASGVPAYPSDGVFLYRYGTTGAGTVQRIALATPGGSPYRARFTVTAVNPTPAATDNVFFSLRIEGQDVADLRFGTAAARALAVRFGYRASVAGTYGVALRNSGNATRSWLGSFTVTAGQVGSDQLVSISVPGDQTGAWAADSSVGMELVVTLQSGSSYQGIPGWQAGNFITVTSQVNLMATNGATFDLFDVGLYDVTGLQQGVIPPFQLESYAADLLQCQRYYEQVAAGVVGTTGGVGGYYSNRVYYKAVKRVSPSVSLLTPISSSNVAGNIYVEGVANYQEGFNATIQANAANSVCSAFGIFVANARL